MSGGGERERFKTSQGNRALSSAGILVIKSRKYPEKKKKEILDAKKRSLSDDQGKGE